jgi:hypothetical protein
MAAEGEMLTVRQKDEAVRRFPAGPAEAAFVSLMARLGAGDDAPPEPEWSQSFYAADDKGFTDPIADLSE